MPVRVLVFRAGLSVVTAAALGAPVSAFAEPPTEKETAADTSAYRALSAKPGAEIRLFGSFELGDGLRFNNPYRLSSELGSGAESVSRTSTYADLGVGLAFGPADGLQHGIALHLSLGLEGVKQQVLTPSYLAAYRGPHRVLVYGRLGTPIIVAPDTSFGFELAGGAGYFLTSKIAVAGELVGDIYYGAGTPQKGVTTYPVLSGQLGLLFDQEWLP